MGVNTLNPFYFVSIFESNYYLVISFNIKKNFFQYLSKDKGENYFFLNFFILYKISILVITHFVINTFPQIYICEQKF